MINISFCSTIIDLQNEIFIITYIMYHTGVNCKYFANLQKKMERGNHVYHLSPSEANWRQVAPRGSMYKQFEILLAIYCFY